jgi:CheY-like chemotaxis protein
MTSDLKILHVEDDFADAMLLQQALQAYGELNIEFEVARTLVDAKYKLMKKRYDLIVTDLRLPDSAKGADTLRVIDKNSGETPYIVLTANVGPDTRDLGEDIVVLNKNAYLQDRDERAGAILHERIMGVYMSEQDTLEI